MAKQHCFDILNEIEDTIGTIRFSDANPLQDLYDMTIAGDVNRLDAAILKLNNANEKYETLHKEEQALDRNLAELDLKLKEIEKKIELLNSGEFVSKSTLESVEKLKEEISHDKKILKMYRDITGVRFSFNSPPDVIAGYVAANGESPSEGKLETFVYKKSEGNIVNEIWKKIDLPAGSEGM